VERRISELSRFGARGASIPQSNVLFGEGGGGTFFRRQTGTSRTKNPYAGRVEEILVDFGAPASILDDASRNRDGRLRRS
jgi:uncharacterized FAD-dependent dehydrogenase